MGLNKTYRDLLKHTGIYGFGQVVGRLASLLLLPVYTHYLSPADYGCIAILDLAVTVFAIVACVGFRHAISRYHFVASSEQERDAVWWTGLTATAVFVTAVVLVTWPIRQDLGVWTLGSDEPLGGYYYGLILPTLWFEGIGNLLLTHLQIVKRSLAFVSVSFGRLLLNATLNVTFLVWGGMRADGILTGNLISSVATCGLLLVLFVPQRGPYTFRVNIFRALAGFAWPMVVTGLLSLLMHQADRYLLRHYVDLDQVGIYSLAYQLGQGINTLILMPFASIWNVLQFEVAEQAHANQVYHRVFRSFSTILLLIMLGISLYARPLLSLISSSAFAAAADLVPIICLAYFFFSITNFLTLPAILEKRSFRLLPGGIAGAALNIFLNLLLIPYFGIAAAAWVSVVTFAAYTAVNYRCCRGDGTVTFPVRATLFPLTCVVGVYVVFRGVMLFTVSPLLLYGVAAGLWAGAGLLLVGQLLSPSRSWVEVLRSSGIPGEGPPSLLPRR
jgi:O-antigen/teichoic acid export membrane protein